MFWKLPWNSQSARRVPSTSENELGERLQEGEVVNSGDSNLSSVSLERTDCCEEPREQLIQVLLTARNQDKYCKVLHRMYCHTRTHRVLIASHHQGNLCEQKAPKSCNRGT